MKGLATSPLSSNRQLWLAALLALLLAGTGLVPSAAAQEGASPQLTVLAEALNVRRGPGVSYPVVDLLVRGDVVSVSGRHAASGWWQVELPDGSTGWVSGGAAYVSISGDTSGVPAVTLEGAAPARPEATALSSPVASQARGTIVFQTASGGAIYAVNTDSLTGTGGTSLRYLTTGMDPALSPDGQWVAFTRWNDTQNGALGSLWIINIDGSGERAVLGDIHQPKSPTWSPDGTQVIISMQHGGRVHEERKCSSERPPREAYHVDMKRDAEGDIEFCYTLPPHPYWGLRVVDMTTGEYEDLPNDLFSNSPAWDPVDPAWLVFDGERGLMGLDLNQGTIWPLTDDVNDHSPVFSPDGSKIAVSYWQNDHWEVHALGADGSGRVRLTQTSIRAILEQQVNGQMPKSWNNVAPAWSRDGSQIAFLTDRAGRWEIWVMNADGNNQRPLMPEVSRAQLNLQYNGMDERVLSWR